MATTKSRLQATVAARHANELGGFQGIPSTKTSVSGHTSALSVRHHGTTGNYEQPTVQCEFQEHQPGHKFATLTVLNPRKLNIVSTPLLHQLIARCKELSTDPALRAVILTGGETAPGKAPAFIGGADIKEMYLLSSSDEACRFITNIHLACRAIRDIPVPVIARVNGYALGAGLEIMAACDLRLATETSTFAMPEVKVGIPSVVEAALLPGLIGMGRTRRLLYLAESIRACEAERWGLVDGVVSDASALEGTVQNWIKRICEMAPAAVREQKRLMQSWEDSSVSEGIAAGIDSFANVYEDGGTEPKKYMGRFLKR